MVEWFRTLSHTERREKIKSMRDFFDKNTGQLLKTVRSLEEVKNCPPDLIVKAKQLIANNMKMMNTLEKIEKGVDDAETKGSNEAVESGTTASGD
jgi:hypothetical protein